MNKLRKKRPKLGEIIANDLRKMIVADELIAGERLPSEDDLAESFGVSRPTMREAIRILESEGLLLPSPKTYGALIINKPEPRQAVRNLGLLFQSEKITLSDVYLARDIFEPTCARIAAEKHPIETADALEAVLKHKREMVGNWEEEIADVVRFHEALVEKAGSQTLTILLKIFNSIFEKHIYRLRNLRAPDQDEKIRSFIMPAEQKLIELIRAGKAEEAEQHWKEHLALVRKSYLRLDQYDEIINVLN